MLLVLEKADSIGNLENLTIEQVEFYGRIWETEGKNMKREIDKIKA